jgi:hypothetical protein
MYFYRIWVCYNCRIISFHPLYNCPSCPGKLIFIKDTIENIREKFPEKPGEWTPAEYDNRFEQPWHRKS